MAAIFLLYGVASYVLFLATFLYAIGFVGNFLVPKSMDLPPGETSLAAIAINLAVLGVFAVQHSVMARRGFKAWWTRIVPPAIERSTYVLATNLALLLIFWQWRPLGGVLWDVSGSGLAWLLWALCATGWGVVLISTFLIDHFELSGLRQVWCHFRGQPLPLKGFRTPSFYRHVRHPIYFGFLLAFWATPVMTVTHLLFALATTGYIVIGTLLEERDLLAHFEDRYREYRARVPMLIPALRRRV